MPDSMPIKNGNGASSTSIISAGKIGINVCFQHNGKMKLIKEMHAYVSKLLCRETKSNFLSSIN